MRWKLFDCAYRSIYRNCQKPPSAWRCLGRRVEPHGQTRRREAQGGRAVSAEASALTSSKASQSELPMPKTVRSCFPLHITYSTPLSLSPSLSLYLSLPLSFYIVVSITACPARDISHIDDIQLIEPVWSMMKALAVFLFIFSSVFLSFFSPSFCTFSTTAPFAVVFCVYKITMLKIKSSARNETSAKTHNTQQIIEQHFIYLPYLPYICMYVWKIYVCAG